MKDTACVSYILADSKRIIGDGYNSRESAASARESCPNAIVYAALYNYKGSLPDSMHALVDKKGLAIDTKIFADEKEARAARDKIESDCYLAVLTLLP